MTNFLGIKQVKRATFEGIANADKLGYLWLVNNGTGTTASTQYELYFGTRKYGSNADNAYDFINKVIASFGGLLNKWGEFVFPVEQEDFINVDESNVTNLYQLLKALDAAIATKLDASGLNGLNGEVAKLKEAINNCLTGVNVVISDTETITGSVADGVVTIDLKSAFAAAGSVKDVKVDNETVVDENGVANISISGKADNSTVNAIANRVATLEGIKHVTDVVYSSNTIYLLDADGNKLGDGFSASEFITDGMLDNVELDGNNLKFTFNTESGKEEVSVDFSKYVDTYHADETTLTLNSETNTFSFKEADAEKINVDEIPVGGTPLADVLLAKNVTAITAGNLQVVLESLFSQNLWAENPRRNIPASLGVSMNDPSITFTPTATNVEVGTEISVSASAANASASASITYEGFTYGYSNENDNTKDGDTPASVSVTGTKDTDSNYKLTFTTNNGFGSKKLADADAQNISSVEGYDNKLIVAEGTNKVTVSASSPTFSATVPAQDAIYACSSLKKTDDDHVVAASEASDIAGAVVTKTKYNSVTGAYYAFVGFADAIPSNDGFRAAIGNGFTRLGKGAIAAGTCNKTYMYVCVPSGWDFTCNTSLGSDMRGSFTDTGDATITLPNGDTKAYKYYALTYKDGAFKDLVIK